MSYMSHTIKQVLHTEEKGEQLLKQTEKKKLKIIEKAKQDALKLISEEQAKIDEQQNEYLKEKEEEIQHKQQKMLAEGATQITLLENASKKHTAKAVKYVLNEFKQEIKG